MNKKSTGQIEIAKGQKVKFIPNVAANPSWRTATFVGYSTKGRYTVKYSHKNIIVKTVRIFEECTDEEIHKELKPQFESLIKTIKDGCEKFNIDSSDMQVNEEELSVYLGGVIVCSSYDEVVSFSHIRQTPAWEVMVEHYYPGTREDPPDVDWSSRGKHRRAVRAAHNMLVLLVNSMLENFAEICEYSEMEDFIQKL